MKTKSRWGRFAVSMQSLAKRPNRRRVEKRQTDNVCRTTVYRNGMRGAKCEGALYRHTEGTGHGTSDEKKRCVKTDAQ